MNRSPTHRMAWRAAAGAACALGLVLLAGCEARIGKDEAETGQETGQEKAGADWKEGAASPAAGKAEEGRFSINAPGFDLKLNLPDQISANTRDDSGLLPPGARLNGLHIEAERREQGGSGVELRFTADEPPERLAAWYQDAARTDFSVTGTAREGASHVLTGTQAEDGDPFRVVLSPRSGGGTDGRLSLSDRS